MTFEIRLEWDDHEFEELLKHWEEPAVAKTLGSGASAFGRAAKPIVREATPSGPSGNPYARAGNLKRAVRYKRIRHVFGIGVTVGSLGKAGWYRHFVIGGTQAHRIRFPDQVRAGVARSHLPQTVGGGNIRHPGARPNPYIERVAGIAEDAGMTSAEKVIFDGLDGKQTVESIDI